MVRRCSSFSEVLIGTPIELASLKRLLIGSAVAHLAKFQNELSIATQAKPPLSYAGVKVSSLIRSETSTSTRGLTSEFGFYEAFQNLISRRSSFSSSNVLSD